jgi:hypothetical protein
MDKSGKKLRNKIRVEYKIPVIVETGDVTIPEIEGVLRDISTQGAKIEADKKLYLGIFLKIYVKTKKEVGPLLGVVKWEKQSEGKYSYGILFDEAHAEQNYNIVEIVTEEILNEIKQKNL